MLQGINILLNYIVSLLSTYANLVGIGFIAEGTAVWQLFGNYSKISKYLYDVGKLDRV